MCSTAFYILACTILMLTSLIPEVNFNSNFYRACFARGYTYDTTYFSFGKLFFYMSMNVLGFIFVNVSNMNCSRRSIFFSRYESRRDFIKTLAFSPVMFFAGNNIAIRGEHDVASLGEEYDYWNTIRYNVGLWTLAYCLGLQFTFLDTGCFHGISLSPTHMRRFSTANWIALVCVLIIGFSFGGYNIYLWYSIEMLWLLMTFFGIEIATLVIVTCVFQRTHYLHVHHYTWAAMLIPLLGV